VKPEKFSLIKKRLLHRQPSINLNLLKLRLENAKNELKEAKYYDYVVVNCQGKLNQAIARTYKIIQKYLN
jgi:guanylate kinase